MGIWRFKKRFRIIFKEELMPEQSGLIASDNYASEEFIISEIFYNQILYLPLD